MKPTKKLYLAINSGCGCKCENCPTKKMIMCNKVTIIEDVNWIALRQVLKEHPKLKEVCLIGENPFKHCNGQLDFFFKLKDIVVGENKLKLTAIADHLATQNTQILGLFDKVYIRVPMEHEVAANFMWLKGFTDVHTYVKVPKLTKEFADFLKRRFYPKPFIITEGESIQRLMKEYPEFDFSTCLIDARVKLYSLTDNRLYSNSRQRNTSKPYIEIYNEKERLKKGSNP